MANEDLQLGEDPRGRRLPRWHTFRQKVPPARQRMRGAIFHNFFIATHFHDEKLQIFSDSTA